MEQYIKERDCYGGNTKECVNNCKNNSFGCSYQTKFNEIDQNQTKGRLEVIADCNTHTQEQLHKLAGSQRIKLTENGFEITDDYERCLEVKTGEDYYTKHSER